MIDIFVFLLFAHALTDWCWQPDTMGLCKNPHLKQREALAPHPECDYLQIYCRAQKKIPWYYWMTAHALAQGAGVFVVTGRLEFALFEVVAHWWIDVGKCLGKYGIHGDQLLHVLSKLLWSYLVTTQ